MHQRRHVNIVTCVGALLGSFALLFLVSILCQSSIQLLGGSSSHGTSKLFEAGLRSKGLARFTSLNLAGLRDRRGQGVYNIPVENHGGGWEQDDYPDVDENQQLKDAQTKVTDLYRPFSDLDPTDPRPPLNGGIEDQQDYASFYRAYSAYQLPHEVSNQGPRNPLRPRNLAAGWTEDGYTLPPYGQPYSRPVQFGRATRPAVTLNAGGDNSVNSFRLSGPGVINVQLGPGHSVGEVEDSGDGSKEGARKAPPAAPKPPKVATDKDWDSKADKLQPCPGPDGPSALPWLSVTPETKMCLIEAEPGAAASFWQDAYDDAYY